MILRWSALKRRVRALFARSRVEREMEEELALHLELQQREHQRRRGLDADAARRAAFQSFGGVDNVREAYRDARGVRPVEDLVQDVRYALRGLRRAPAFTLVALLTLALGIGVNASIFSVVNAILFRPLPVERPEELVDIYGHDATSRSHDTHSYPNYVDYRAGTRTLSGITAYSNFFANLSIGGSSEIVIGEIVTDNYFQLLGVRPILGRAFLAEEYAAQGAFPVAVITSPAPRSVPSISGLMRTSLVGTTVIRSCAFVAG